MLSRFVSKRLFSGAVSTASARPKVFNAVTAESAAPPLQLSIFDSIFSSKYPRVPLNQTFEGTPALQDPAVFGLGALEVTKLPSGVRVASLQNGSPIASIGVHVDFGSRYENHQVSGLTHFFETLALKTTANRTQDKLVRDMAKIGANVIAQAGREHILYYGESLRHSFPAVLASLADVIQFHAFDVAEVKEAVGRYPHVIKNCVNNPDAVLSELLHEAAFSGQGLGQPFIAPSSNLQKFTPEVLRVFAQTAFQPKNITVVGAGVEHAEFVKLVEELFQYLPEDSSQVVKSKSVYTGGDVRLASQYDRNQEGDDLAHVALGFESAPASSNELFAASVLQFIMGGGASFSTGGPGKGMYTRIYTNILNVESAVEAAECVHLPYSDTGLIALTGKSYRNDAPKLVEVLAREAVKMAGPINADELQRAKNRLKQLVNSNLETRTGLVDDIARSLSLVGKWRSQQELLDGIEKVSEKDVQNLASKLLSSPVTVAACGQVSLVPRAEQVRRLLQ